MDGTARITSMTEDDRHLQRIVADERPRLLNFIRRRVSDPSEVEDVVQDVFYELVRANRLLMPIEHLTGWLFQVARNRITDLFRRTKEDSFRDGIEDLLPSPEAGPEALYERRVLLAELAAAIDELPDDQRAVFVAHELEGRSFKELSADTGVKVNTLLSRKRNAVLRLRERLQSVHDEFTKK